MLGLNLGRLDNISGEFCPFFIARARKRLCLGSLFLRAPGDLHVCLCGRYRDTTLEADRV